MKFIATILATAAAVTLEHYHDDHHDDGVLLAVGDGLTPLDVAGLYYDDHDHANNLNVFNFYGPVYGDIQGIADDDGLEQLALTRDGLVFGADGAILDGALSTTVLPGLGAIAVDADGLEATDDDGLALAASLGGLQVGRLAGRGLRGVALGGLGPGSAGLGALLPSDTLIAEDGTLAAVDGGAVDVLRPGSALALEGAPALGTGLGGAAITSAAGGWCGYNASKGAAANCAPGLTCVNAVCTDLAAFEARHALPEATGDRFHFGEDPFVTLNTEETFAEVGGDMVAEE